MKEIDGVRFFLENHLVSREDFQDGSWPSKVDRMSLFSKNLCQKIGVALFGRDFILHGEHVDSFIAGFMEIKKMILKKKTDAFLSEEHEEWRKKSPLKSVEVSNMDIKIGEVKDIRRHVGVLHANSTGYSPPRTGLTMNNNDEELDSMVCLGIAAGACLLFKLQDSDDVVLPRKVLANVENIKKQDDKYLDFFLSRTKIDDKNKRMVKRLYKEKIVKTFANHEKEIGIDSKMQALERAAKNLEKNRGGTFSLVLLLFAKSATNLFSEENLWKELRLSREHRISPIYQSFDVDARDLEFVMKHIVKCNEENGKIHKAKLDTFFSLTVEATLENMEISRTPKIDGEPDSSGIEL